MRLIIAEKHSVGQAIAQAVGGHMEKHDGYVQVGDDLVAWAQGHLVDLAAPDEYKDHDWDRWSLDTLPIDWIGNGVLDRFLEDESLFGEFLRTPVSEGGVEPLVVEPPHVVVEVGA